MDRRATNRHATQAHIRSTLLSLLSQGRYLSQISTTELCGAAGIAKSTFYLYYPDKYAVLEQIVSDTFNELKAINDTFESYSISDIVAGKPTPIALNLVHYLASHKDVLRVLLSPTGVPDFMYQGKAEIESKFLELYRALHLKPQHETLIASQFFSGVIGLFRFYLFENTRYTETEMAIVFGNMLRSVLTMADHLR